MAGVRPRVSLRKIRLNAVFISAPKTIDFATLVVSFDSLLEGSRHSLRNQGCNVSVTFNSPFGRLALFDRRVLCAPIIVRGDAAFLNASET